MNKELENAIGLGENERAKEILNDMMDINEANELGVTPLMCASNHCNVEMVEYLLENGADVNLRNIEGQSALHMVGGYMYMGIDGYEGRKKITRVLLENGANPNLPDNEGNTSLHYAVFKMRHELINTILEYGGDVNAKNIRGMGALEFALLKSDEESVSMLIERGFDSEELKSNLRIALPNVMSFKKLVEYMVNKVLYDLRNDNDDSVLSMVTRDTFFKDNLLEKIALDRAIKLGKTELAEKIIENKLSRGESIDEKDISGNTLAHFAVYKDNVKLLRILVCHGAKLDIKNENGNTPLHLLCLLNKSDIADKLVLWTNSNMLKKLNITYEKDVEKAMNMRNKGGNTPLHLACMLDRTDIVKKLGLRSNFNVLNGLNASDKTAMDIAIENNNTVSQRYLQDYNNNNVVENILRLKRIEPKYTRL